MKKTRTKIVSILLVSFAVSACGSGAQQGKAEAEASRKIVFETMELTGEQRFEDVEMEEDVVLKDKQYHYKIVRSSSDELPTVQGDFSTKAQFHDNTAKLVITCGDRQVLSRTYTKKDFAEFVDNDMMTRSVLRGFVYVEALENELEFAVAVGYPQDDEMYIPILLKVKPDGSVTMEKDNTLDEPAVPYVEEEV